LFLCLAQTKAIVESKSEALSGANGEKNEPNINEDAITASNLRILLSLSRKFKSFALLLFKICGKGLLKKKILNDIPRGQSTMPNEKG